MLYAYFKSTLYQSDSLEVSIFPPLQTAQVKLDCRQRRRDMGDEVSEDAELWIGVFFGRSRLLFRSRVAFLWHERTSLVRLGGVQL